MSMNSQSNKRTLLIIVSAIDAILSGAILLIYFGLLPFDISSWGIQPWAVGLCGGICSPFPLAFWLINSQKQISNRF